MNCRQHSTPNVSGKRGIPAGLNLSGLMDIWRNLRKFDSSLIAPLPGPYLGDLHVPANESIKCDDIFSVKDCSSSVYHCILQTKLYILFAINTLAITS